MKFNLLNSTIFVNIKISKLFLPAIGILLLLTCRTSTALAVITWSGDIKPLDPTTWTSDTSAYIGNSSTGTITVDGQSQLLSKYGYIGRFPGSDGNVIVTGTGSQWINGAYLFVGNLGSGKLTVTDGGTVTVNKGLFASIDNLFGDGVISTNGLVLDNGLVFDSAHGLQQTLAFGAGGRLNLSQNGDGVLGAGYKGLGTLRIAGGVAVPSSSGYLGYYTDSSGAATVTGTGSQWIINNELQVGYYGNGTLTIEAGGQVITTAGSSLGSRYDADPSGTATVTGANSKWTCDNFHLGNGSLTIEDGGQVSSTNLCFLGGKSNTTATATVTGAGSTWTSGDFTIGINGNATLRVEAGGQVNCGTARIYAKAGKAVEATVSGLGSKWMNTSGLYVGDANNPKLRIEEGGEVSDVNGYLGFSSSTTGTVTVTGTGSKWSNSSDLFVGSSGNGILNIEAGGHVNSTNCYLGYNTGSVGTLSIQTGGQVSLTNCYLGYNSGSIGSLSIQTGGQVSSTNCNLALGRDSTGTATITGIDSKWINNGTLFISKYGNGTLNVGSGSLITTKTLTMNGNATFSTGTCNLNGGTLLVETIAKGGGGTANFNWLEGTIRNYDANTDLTISDNLAMKLGSTGAHVFNIDSGRTGTVNAVLSDATSGGTLYKSGGGLLKLTKVNTYTGTTTIAAGTLALGNAGSLASSLIDVQTDATFDVSAKSGAFVMSAGQMLQGPGTILGNLTMGGIHVPAPGTSPGIQTVQGNYSMWGQLNIKLAGTVAGKGYDQVLLSGGTGTYNVLLVGTLNLDWSSLNGSTDTTELWILKNDSDGSISNAFSNYPHGTMLGNHDGRDWYIWYGADAATGNTIGGNDVVITPIPVPEPSIFIQLALGAATLWAWSRRRRR